MSTDKQESSIASQERVLREYAAKNQYKIIDSYIDEGLSGKKAEKRPAFMRMIEDSGRDMFDFVLIYDSSRFARNLEESIVYKSVLKRNGVALVSITEPTLDDDSALITDAMLGALNEMHSRKLSRAVKRGMVDKAMQGNYQTPPPFGYKKDGVSLAIVPEEAKIIKLIFSLFIERSSWHSVAVQLNNMGINKRNAYGWYSRDIKRMLQNPVYIGKLTYDSVVYNGKHESIIDLDLWENVQNIIENKPKRKTRPSSTYKHWLSGIMKCAYCGGGMNHFYDKNKNAFYRCSKNSNGCCNYSNCLGIKKLELIAIQSLEMITKNNNLSEYTNFTKKNDISQLESLNIALKKIQNRLERHKVAYSNGVDSLEEYRANKEKCAHEEIIISEQIKTLSADEIADEKVDHFKETVKNLIETLLSDAQTIEQKSNAIKPIIDRIVIDKYNNNYDFFYFI